MSSSPFDVNDDITTADTRRAMIQMRHYRLCYLWFRGEALVCLGSEKRGPPTMSGRSTPSPSSHLSSFHQPSSPGVRLVRYRNFRVATISCHPATLPPDRDYLRPAATGGAGSPRQDEISRCTGLMTSVSTVRLSTAKPSISTRKQYHDACVSPHTSKQSISIHSLRPAMAS